MKALRRGGAERRSFATLVIVAGLLGRPALGQVPGLPAAPATSRSSPAASQGSPAATKGSAQPAAEKAKPAVATSTGPITVHQQVSDRDIQRFLTKFLPKYPGVEKIQVSVDEGVVTLTGRVDDDETQEEHRDPRRRWKARGPASIPCRRSTLAPRTAAVRGHRRALV